MFTGLNRHKTFQIFNYYIYGGISCNILKTKLVPIVGGLDPPQAFFKLVEHCISSDSSYSTQILCFKGNEIELDTEMDMTSKDESLVSANQHSPVTIHWNTLYVTGSAKRGVIADPNHTHLECHILTCEFSTTLKLGPNIPPTLHYCLV